MFGGTVPNKWRLGEMKEYVQKEMESVKNEIIKIKAQIMQVGDDEEKVYFQFSFLYIQKLERYIELKNKMESLEKTIVGLTTEKIKMLEDISKIDF
jgi:hypothetical protein